MWDRKVLLPKNLYTSTDRKKVMEEKVPIIIKGLRVDKVGTVTQVWTGTKLTREDLYKDEELQE